MPAEQPKSSGSDDSEQWEVVNDQPVLYFEHPHIWKVVRLRNRAGQLSGGLWCQGCGRVQAFTKTQLTAFGSTPVPKKKP